MPATVAFVANRSALERAARDVSDTREAYDAAREQRDQLILDAIDQGMPQRAVAKATALSQPRIVAIVLNLSADQESAAPPPPRPPTHGTPGTIRRTPQQRPAVAAG